MGAFATVTFTRFKSHSWNGGPTEETTFATTWVKVQIDELLARECWGGGGDGHNRPLNFDGAKGQLF